MISFVKSLVSSHEREIAKARKVVKQINALEPAMQERTYEQMQERVAQMRSSLKELSDAIPENAKSSLKRIDRGNGLPTHEVAIQDMLTGFMPEFYAMMREVMRREYDRRHFDVQLVAGVILAQGQRLTELKTGEGKTQVFQLPLFLYSLVGRGAHLVTVNDYLAKRDGEYAGRVAAKLGLSVGIITPGNSALKYIDAEQVKKLKGESVYKELTAIKLPGLSDMKGLQLIESAKKDAYACDITVGVNNEFGFDYLRDNMATTSSQLVQRELYFCIVDEADSILIDEARTPLIISALPEDSDVKLYEKFAKVADTLVEDKDYTIDHKSRSALLTEEGILKAEKALQVDNLWEDYKLVHHLENALKAKALYLLDDQYIVRDGEVLIVDSFTGRVMSGRRFSEGMHQAIEAKEGVTVQQENRTMATITFQNYFRLYKVLVGGSGTIMTEAEEFYKIYTVESVEVPTNRPVVREDLPDYIYRNEGIKFKAVAAEVKERYDAGQPVLIGTTSVAKSEALSQMLDELQVPHEVLNAKYHEREAQIVAKAGQQGAVTVATNMAGRGTDIPLSEEVKTLGGLAVIGTERHEARRIDNQLRGRAGRQGDPGYTRFYVSLDDQIMKIMAGEVLQKTIGRLMVDDLQIQSRIIAGQIEGAQKKLEGVNFDIRKNLVDYDDVLNKHREVFYSRRRNTLELTDKALGIYPLSESDQEQAAEIAKQAHQDLEQQLTESFREEIVAMIELHIPGGGKLQDEEDIKAFVAEVLDLAEDTDIADAFDISRSADLTSELSNRYRGKKHDYIKEDLTSKILQLLDAKIKELGANFPQAAKAIMLDAMNRQWMDHLETMDDIRSGINLQAYAQRDPLVEYKTIGFQKFTELLGAINNHVARRFLKISGVSNANDQLALTTNVDQIEDILTGDRELLPRVAATGDAQLDKLLRSANARIEAERQAAMLAGSERRTYTRIEQKTGRNELCTCGSGKKYKNCGLINSPEHQARMAKS